MVLKDGSIRAVLLVSSINFALKSEDEQNALIAGYTQFVNSFDYPFQIVIQSRQLDIEGYIRALREQQKAQENDLLRTQIAAYTEYVQELIELGEIMTKRFFLVLPYSVLGDKKKGFFSRLQEVLNPGGAIRIRRKEFEKYKTELSLRVGQAQSILQGMGLDSARLDTQGLIELYYNAYNPKTSQNQKLAPIEEVRVDQEF